MLSRSALSLALALATAVTSAVATPTVLSAPTGVTGENTAATSAPAPVEPTEPAEQQEQPEADLPAGMTLEEIAVVVPAVEPTGEVIQPTDLPLAQADDAVIVTDQLVGDGRVESEVVETDGFQTLGVTWPQDASVDGLDVQVRTRAEDGWGDWVVLEVGDDGPDAGTPDAENAAARGGTDPLWVGEADAVQVSFAASEQGGPEGIELALISSDAVATDAVVGSVADEGLVVQNASYLTSGSVGTAAVETVSTAGAPRVISRAQWGAPAQVCKPAVASKLVAAVVHHTAGSNNYATQAQAMQQLRNDAAYHINGRGWCDLGYNFVVDKWGNIYEGRAGSMTQPVVGVHAGGFNTGTLGVSMLGTYGSLPPIVTQQAVAEIIGWRLGAYGVDPRGSFNFYTSGGQNSRFANQNVWLPRVLGHREVAFTACPGDGGMAALPGIRNAAWAAPSPGRAKEAAAVVNALYADLLGRKPDSGGLNTWAGLYVSGAGSSALVAGVTSSEEYHRRKIAEAYRTVLGRTTDEQGVRSWLAAISAGTVKIDEIANHLVASEEFFLQSGGTNGGLVRRMYTSLLGRTGSSAEINYWTARVPSLGRGGVISQVTGSREAAQRKVQLNYRHFLARYPDISGQNLWTDVLLVQGEAAVRSNIVSSEEYRLRAIARFP
ncbi:DUF4214 domain-containing protein [Actinotalea sp. K2]|uniref:DUF4214 domain-containing protein n=1 Tax=Actinotalea sp. K2 TaxID=2939438 RepID=UPI002016DA16|nr:DUF4214 domain-containing protein [Actinotalea sp. K2]MCL3862725.1 DUF4214 domain-containing protein [Actinotalea sp. K2]